MEKRQTIPSEELRYFMHARRFARADEYMRREKDENIMNVIGLTTIVLSAFASELYLKCLHVIENGTAPRGHNLKNLYRNLSGKTRRGIVKRWDAYMPSQESVIKVVEDAAEAKVPRDFETLLSMGGRAFEEMRYPSEHYATGFFLSDLPRVLETLILDEIRPEWRGIRHAPPTPHPHRKPTLGVPSDRP